MAGDENEKPPTIDFHYIKSPQFSSLPVHGAFGGPTPQGLIAATLYSERHPIPKRVTHGFRGDGSLDEGKPSDDSLSGIVRQLEAEVFLTPEIAESLGEWLLEQVREFKAVKARVGPSADTEQESQ